MAFSPWSGAECRTFTWRPILPLGVVYIFFMARHRRICPDVAGYSPDRFYEGFRQWALGEYRLASGRCVNRQGSTPAPRRKGFVPANCSRFRLMPWGKGATPREPTEEKPRKHRGNVNLAPDIPGAKSGYPRIIRMARLNLPLHCPLSSDSSDSWANSGQPKSRQSQVEMQLPVHGNQERTNYELTT